MCDASQHGHEREYPLSHGQRALWFVQQLVPDNAAYNIVRAMRLHNRLDVQALRQAWSNLSERHPALRTCITSVDGEPVQRVSDRPRAYFEVIDATALSDAALQDRLAAEVYRPFDLEHDALMRLSLFARTATDNLMVTAFHHSVTDLWSTAIMLHELGVFYDAANGGASPDLKALRTTYGDHVLAQRAMLAGPDGERLAQFWRSQFATGWPEMALLTDRPRPAVLPFRARTRTERLSSLLSRQLAQLAKDMGVTPFSLVMVAFQVLLRRYTGLDDVLVATPVAGRSASTARLVGYFVNPVVVRGNLAGDPTFAEFARQVHATTTAALAHGAYPFGLLVEDLQPARDLSRPPITPVMFAWQKTTGVAGGSFASLALHESGARVDAGGLIIESVPLEHQVTPYELTLLMAEEGEDLVASLEYNVALFDAATAARMLGHLATLLRGIVADPNRHLSALPLLTDGERALLSAWSDTGNGRHGARLVHDSVLEQCRRHPERQAVAGAGAGLSYGELTDAAAALARRIAEAGVQRGAVIGACLHRSADAVTALLAALMGGYVYLPLDPALPPDRLAFMVEDSGAALVVCQDETVSVVPSSTPALVVDELWRRVAGEGATPAPASPDDPAYIIYTSGSTGRPKAVVVNQGALAEHCRDIARHYDLDASDSVLQFASLSFDASLEQILPPLTVGARVVLRDREVWTAREMRERIGEQGITVINVPPSYWRQLVEEWERQPDGGDLATLRLIIVGGDRLTAESVGLWRRSAARQARLLNAYGPTETTITAMTHEPSREGDSLDWEDVPIGRPLANRRAWIADTDGNLAPVGVAGELWLGGLGVADGYLGRPELTAERFLAGPSGAAAPERCYRTGDLARYLPDGTVAFLGRLDDQVKVRGHRIEIGEVEAAIREVPGIGDVAVTTAADEVGDRRLVAYFVPGGDGTSVEAMETHLRGRLPEYMLPSAWVELPRLPLTAGGKVDRRALPALPAVRRATATGIPSTPLERDMAATWAKVLGLAEVGAHDDFFQLGGHSLLATRLVSAIGDGFGVEVPLRVVFDRRTVAGVSEFVAEELASAASADDVERLLAEMEATSPAAANVGGGM
ncbi:MAG: non-ribosomal peptide synthetase [Anaerolineae bacterium]